jgi:NAD(P)-dependent dehydrogenase (short-subunit alcohol dehydrogenase family)
VALVTGAAQGIGAAVSRVLAAEGAAVLVTDVQAQAGRAVAEALCDTGAEARFLRLDVRSEAQWKRAVEYAVRQFGALHVLVNNAAVAIPKDVEATSLREWQGLMAVNLEGVFLGTKHAIPALRRGGGGSIVNLSSTYGIIGASGSIAYSASKAGVRGFTRAAALYCARHGLGIRVNTICPGAVLTPLLERQLARHPRGRATALRKIAAEHPINDVATPEDIAWGVVYLASDEARFVTGIDLIIDGGQLAQ